MSVGSEMPYHSAELLYVCSESQQPRRCAELEDKRLTLPGKTRRPGRKSIEKAEIATHRGKLT